MKIVIVDSGAWVSRHDVVARLGAAGHMVEIVQLDPLAGAGRSGWTVRRSRPKLVVLADDVVQGGDRQAVIAAARSVGAVVVIMSPLATNAADPTQAQQLDWALVSGEDERAMAISRFALPAYRVVAIGDPGDLEWPARLTRALEQMAAIGRRRPVVSPAGVRLASLLIPRFVTAAEKRHATDLPAESSTSPTVRELRPTAEKSTDKNKPKVKTKILEPRGRILILARDPDAVLRFEEVIRHTAHLLDVHVVIEGNSTERERRSAERIMDSIVGVTHGAVPGGGRHHGIIGRVRWCNGYWQLLERDDRQGFAALRQMEANAPGLIGKFARNRIFRSRRVRAPFLKVFAELERQMPADTSVMRFLEEQPRPKLLLLTSLVEPGSSQIEYMRAARALEIPTLFCASEWSQLTNAGSIREVPDYMAVWNAEQRREAIELLGIPPQRTCVVGALGLSPIWEKPTLSRASLAKHLRLDRSEIILAYLGSNSRVAREADFFRDWVLGVRSHPDRRLREAAIVLVPGSGGAWGRAAEQAVSGGNVAIARRSETKGTYSQSVALHHADAIVAASVDSALAAAMIGSPVFGISAKELGGAGRDFVNFQRKHGSRAPWFRLGNGLDEHFHQVIESLEGHDDVNQRRARMAVNAFLRPHGQDVSPGSIIANWVIKRIERQDFSSPKNIKKSVATVK